VRTRRESNQNKQTPNLILICSDQLRTNSIGAYGSAVCCTPNLDRFAAQGVTLDRCFAENPVCMPSRATMFTGLESRHHGATGNSIALPRSFPTLADVLKTAGYRTVAVGKLHLTPQSQGIHAAPHYGFDETDSTEDNRIGPYLDWALRNFPEHEGYLLGTLFNLPMNDDYWRGRRDLRKEYLQAREKHVVPLEISKTCNWGFGHFSPLPEEAHPTRWITDRAIARLTEHDTNRPLLLWVGYVAPHNPFDPPKRFRERYQWEDVALPVGLELDESRLPVCVGGGRRYYKQFTERDHRVLRALYYGSVTFLDEQIGRLLAEIERRFDMNNTIVMCLADHGEHLGDHGLYGKSCYHYDASIRVPCICRWDGHWQRGARSRGIVELTDLMPTLLDACSIPKQPTMDGRSFAPLLRGEATAGGRDHAFIESYDGGPEDPTPAPFTHAKTIRTARWRATFFSAGQPGRTLRSGE
jgi:arylsulfatase A-like enzyme